MSDRELLELAAKAAGYWIVGPVEKYIVQLGQYENGFVIRNDRGGDSCWNPLTDDGDALRLAVKLKMRLHVTESCAAVDIYADGAWAGEIKVGCMDSGWNEDPHAATRRAIVRAAAALGEPK